MNKIYKVVWSKVKHCYVVTSELAKRQTKGCGARSLRMATVSLGVAASLLCAGAVLPIFGESVAEAKTTTEKQGNKIINTTTHYTTVFNFQYPEKSVTIGATEINKVTNAYGVFGNVAQRVGQQKTDNVSFKVIDGQLIEIHDVNQYYLEPYQRVLTGHPFNFSNGTDSDIDDEIKNSDGAKSDVTGYSLTITGGTLQEVAGGLSNGGNVSNNTININDGTINKAVYGGYTTQSGNVSNNTVNLNGGIIKGTVYGGYSEDGAAADNTVNISGGTIGSSGWTSIVGGSTSGNSASNNTITISGNPTFVGDVGIYGGQSYLSTGGIANNNTVNILTKIVVAELMGGDVLPGGTSSGNTLNIAAKGVTTGTVYGFQNLNFFLPSDIANNDTMLTVNGSNPTNVKGVTFGVAALSGVKLVKGDTVNLITNPSGLTTDDSLKTTDSATLAKAEFLSANSLTTDDAYELSISKKDANTIIATVDNVTEKKAPEDAVDDIKKSPVETRAGVVTLLNAGTDMLVSQGMANAADAAAAERSGGNAAAAPRAGGFAPFAAVGLGNLRAESGSHVDTKSIGLNLGFAREIENKSGKLLVGPVVEYGHGSYDSYQDNGITADGKSSYWGIGVIAKQTNNNGFYYEGSIRAGRTKSDYGSDNVKPGTHVSYDSSATYWALHLGAGKLVDIGHSNTLDYYGKYFYSHTGSDSVFLNGANETANFDAVNSHRIRLGARFIHAINEKNNIYGGLAWQYEFNGDARATYSVSGEAPSPSVKGSSGMIELGWQVKPGKSPMTIDLGVTGWVGKQRGITANVQANWTF